MAVTASKRRIRRKPRPSRGELWGLLLAMAAGLAAVSLFTDRAGVIGGWIRVGLNAGAGGAALWWLILAVGIGVGSAVGGRAAFSGYRLAGLGLAALLVAGWYHVGFPAATAWEAGVRGFGGGMIGAAVSLGLLRGFGAAGRAFVLVSGWVVVVVLVGHLSPRTLTVLAAQVLRWVGSRVAFLARGLGYLLAWTFRRRPGPASAGGLPESRPTPAIEVERDDEHLTLDVTPIPDREIVGGVIASSAARDEDSSVPVEAPSPTRYEQLAMPDSGYQLPPLELLGRPAVRPGRGRRDVRDRARILEETLASFGIAVRIVGITQGPAVTRFELQPAPGVKVSRVVSLASDLALALAAPDVRIEAPIPGKAAIGVEVPNEHVAVVTLREVLASEQFRESPSPLTVGIGRDVSGQPVVARLDRLLHVLIAGATGSGKSVCLNSMIASLLCRATPAELRLLLIDPKMVELSNYNGIPHLLAPVVTDPKQAAGCLRWAVVEMERRYALFARASVKEIARYNDLRVRDIPDQEYLPYVVVVIDELSDLMAVAPGEVEDCIQRLAQMARAAGIHLIVATQRPSVDVITGVVKANIPSRIAFAVASGVDSRTILDMGGAERLVGRGDMLMLPAGAGKPARVQGAFVSDREVESLVAFWRQQGGPSYANVSESSAEKDGGDEDELLPEAARIVVEYGQASASLLQRRLKVGYARAARIIDQLEDRGLVGPHEGSRPREVRLTREEWQRLFGPAKGDR